MADKMDVFEKRIVDQNGDIRERVVHFRHIAGTFYEESNGLMPDASGVRDIGSVTLAWDDAHIDQVYLKANPSDPLQAATKQYVDAATSSSSPAGSDTQLQYNNGGVMGGTTYIAYNDTTGDINFLSDISRNGTQWNSGDNIDADVVVDGSTNAMPTLTQETNWDNHLSNNSQAHSDYLINTGDTIAGNLDPEASGTRNLGTVALAFNDAHIDKLYLEGDPTTGFEATTKDYVDTAVAGAAGETDHSALTNLGWSNAGHTIDSALTPTASGTIDIGSVALAFNNTYTDKLVVDDITIDGNTISAGPHAGGTLTLGGAGSTNNETLTLDFETTNNYVKTGGTASFFEMAGPGLLIPNDKVITFGASNYAKVGWETTGNDNFQIGVNVGSSTQSGYVSIMETADMGNANRSPSTASDDPVLRVYSSDAATEAVAGMDYIEMYHDQTDSQIRGGSGDLEIRAPLQFKLDSGWGTWIFSTGGTGMVDFRSVSGTAQTVMGVTDLGGNQLILTNSANASYDHAHDTTTNPTLFIHSDAQTTDEWISLTHDQTNGMITSGTGNVGIVPASNIVSIHDSTNDHLELTVVADTAKEARFDLQSGSDTARLFYRDSDYHFGIYHDNGTSTQTRFRITPTEMMLMENASGNVECFGVGDVLDTDAGKKFIIHRKAAGGDNSLDLWVRDDSAGQIDADGLMYLSVSGRDNVRIYYDRVALGYEGAMDGVTLGESIDSGESMYLRQHGYITAAGANKYIQWEVNDTTDNFELTREDDNIDNFDVQIPLIATVDGYTSYASGAHILAKNTTANDGATAQSAMIGLQAEGWNGASQTVNWYIEGDGMTNGNPTLRIRCVQDGGADTEILGIDAGGQFTSNIVRTSWDQREDTSSTYWGINLSNDAAATAGYDQFAPMVHWDSKVWNTNGGGSSQSSSFDIRVEPESGDPPTSVLTFVSGYNAASPNAEIARLTWDGTIKKAGIFTAAPALSPSALPAMGSVMQIGDNVTAPELRLAGPNGADVASKIVFDNSSTGQGMSMFFTSDTTPYGQDGIAFWDENNGKLVLKLDRETGNIGLGTASPTTFKVQASGNIGPDASGIYDLGSVAVAFDDAYIDKVHLEANPTLPLQAATKQYVDDAMASATPAGSDTQVQYNNGGVMGGAVGLTYNDGNQDVTFGNDLLPAASGAQDVGSVALAFNEVYSDTFKTEDMIISGGTIAAGPHAGGTLTLGGIGGANNETLTLDFETTNNYVRTGGTASFFEMTGPGLLIPDDKVITFGGTTEVKMGWETTDNDNFQIGVRADNDSVGSGYVSIMQVGDMGNVNRSPIGTSADPVLRIYSSDETQANDYIEMYHDQSNGRIATGTNGLVLDVPDGQLFLQDSNVSGFVVVADIDNYDQITFGLYSGTGNQLILTNSSNIKKDHDHAFQTNPTLYIHSDTDPDTSNDEWISFTHDVTDAVIANGSGNILLDSANVIVLDSVPGAWDFEINGTTHVRLRSSNVETHWGSDDLAGNMFLLCNIAGVDTDHGHGLQTDPTLFIHSDTVPGATDEWIGFWHDKTDGQIQTGSGDLKLQSNALGDVTLFEDTDVGDAVEGKSLIIHRRAAEGDLSLRLYIDPDMNAHIKSDLDLEFNAPNNIYFARNPTASNLILFFHQSGSGDASKIQHHGYITADTSAKYIQWEVNDTTDNFELTGETGVNEIGAFDIQMPLITDAITASAAITPTASGTIDLGTLALAWDDAYIDKVYLEGDPTTQLEAATKQYVDDQDAAADTHITSNGSDHTYIDQDVTSGSTPTFNADNLSDGGSNAIVTTTQETNWDNHIVDSSQAHTDYLLNNASDITTGTLTVAGLTLSDPGVGNSSIITFSKSSDSASVRVEEYLSDRTAYTFFMGDNPDGTNDYFNWYFDAHQGAGADWMPLLFSNLRAEINCSRIDMRGNVYLGTANYYTATSSTTKPYFSTANGTVWENKTGTASITVDVSSYTGTDTSAIYSIEIDGDTPDTFKWNNARFDNAWTAETVSITGSAQTLNNGIAITFDSTTNADLGDQFQFRVFSGGTTTTGKLVAGDLVSPSASGSIDLGTLALAFDQAYIDKVYLEGDPTTPLEAATKQYVDDNAGAADHSALSNLEWSAAGHTVDSAVNPTASGTIDLGTVSLAYDDAYIDKVYLSANPTLPLQAATKQYVDAGVSSGLFELDGSGDLMPVVASAADNYFELDGNDDIQPILS